MHATDSFDPDFVDLLQALTVNDVEFVVVGAFALGRHGYVRATGDLDILFRPSPDNVRRLIVALAAFGAPAHLTDPAGLLVPDTVTQLGVRPHRIDLLNGLTGVSVDEAFAGAVFSDVGGHPVPVLGLEELRRNKLATGRESDLRDVAELDRITRQN
jgi:hypothetical protein